MSVPKMSGATADILFGAAPTRDELGDLQQIMWRIVDALDATPAGAGMAFAGLNVVSDSVEPPMPDLDFDLVLPAWESV